MAAPSGAHPAYPLRQINANNLGRQQTQYNTATYQSNTPFQHPTQAAQQSRAPAQLEPQLSPWDSLSEEHQEEISEAFGLFDLDKDNRIDYHETKVAFKALGFELSKPELLSLLQTHGTPANLHAKGKAAANSNQNATFTGPSRLLLSIDVFQNEAAIRVGARDPQEEILRAFELFDQNGTGVISLDDLRRVAGELGEGLQEEELRAMIDEFDVRGQGGISREEFLGICMG